MPRLSDAHLKLVQAIDELRYQARKDLRFAREEYERAGENLHHAQQELQRLPDEDQVEGFDYQELCAYVEDYGLDVDMDLLYDEEVFEPEPTGGDL
jgi:hypothetical protein